MSDNDEDDSDEEEEKFSRPERQIFFIPARAEIDVKEEAATGANDEETLIEKKKPSIRMQRRQFNRRAKKLVEVPPISNNDYIKYLNANAFLSPSFIRAFQIVLITVYGMYALMAFLIMIFYITDYKMALFDYTFIADAATIMIIFLSFTLFLSIIGCYSTYLIGLSKDRTEELLNINQGLNVNHNECVEVSKFMREDGKNFMVENDIFIVGQADVKYELSKTLHRLHKLGVSLNSYEKEFKNEKIRKIIHFVQMVYQDMYIQNVKLRALQDRSKIIKSFYRKQLQDGKSGLSRNEFNEMKETLDIDSKDQVHERLFFRFPDFDEFDRDGNENVDTIEFEETLNQIYKTILDDIEKKYRSNKTPKELAYEKEFYKSDTRENRNLLASFKKYMKPKKKQSQ
eukprot:279488_1